MKYFFVILLLSLSLVSLMTSELVYGESDDFRFVELNDSYFLGDKITIKFEKITQQPCPSYEISMMKEGFTESMMNVGVEPLCAIPGPVEPYLFSDDLAKSEFFNSVGTYIIKVKLDDEIIQKEIKITDNRDTSLKELDGFFTVNEKQVRYVIPYTISNGTINDMTLYCEHASLLVKITPQTESDGMLVLDFPRSIMDPKTNDGTPIDENTVFEIGSITKVFITLLLADMVEKGEINLDDPIDRFLPEDVTTPSKNGKKITLLDLATHTSGLSSLPSDFPIFDPDIQHEYDREEMYDYLSSFEISRDIGSQYEYSNIGVALIGHIISLHSGQSYEELAKERIWDKFGMNNTCIKQCEKIRDNFAKPHSLVFLLH